MTNFVEIVTTVDKREDAERIANSLLTRKLAACVQIVGPVTSVYPWKNKVQTTEEWVCHIKSRQNLFNAAQTIIKDIHPYDLPEIIATPITAASEEYLDWLDSNLRK